MWSTNISLISACLFSVGILVSLAGLVDILRNVLTLQLPHALYLVEVHHKALVVRVVELDALPAEYGLVV